MNPVNPMGHVNPENNVGGVNPVGPGHAASPVGGRRVARAVRWFILRRGEKISAVVMGVVFAVFLIAALGLPFGNLASPGPGLWPSSISVLGLVMVGLLFFIGKDIPVLAKDQSGRRLVLFMAAIILYAPVYSVIGFIPTSAIVLFALIRFGGGFGWVTSSACAVVGAVAVYLIFGVGLSLPIDAF